MQIKFHNELYTKHFGDSVGKLITALERLRFTFTLNGKRGFVPHDQVFPLIVVYCLILLHKK